MTVTELCDADLARRCRQGDPAAWRALVRRVSPLVYRIAVRLLGHGAEAEDAGQEALLRVHRSFESFDPTRPLEPWVAQVTYRICLKQLARRQRPGAPIDDVDQLAQLPDVGVASPEDATAQAEAGALVGAALARLGPEDRVLVTLTYQDGLSNSAVAEAMDMPIGTVKTRLHRARARLRELLRPALQRGEAR
ncbi:MAG: sigma-70 family RNA polymerase sigma factor [Myxococcales bacterium]|nr:sigma-70 family RNA polymerase sigma factor [Myxococcales bacterium]